MELRLDGWEGASGEQTLEEEAMCTRPWRHWCTGSSESEEGAEEGQAWLLADTSSVQFISGSCGELACFLTALDGFKIRGDVKIYILKVILAAVISGRNW